MRRFYRVVFILITLGALSYPFNNSIAALPAEAYIPGVPAHAQSFSLSCESRSAADWAAYWGVKTSELKILAKLPRTDDPETGFVGNPKASWGGIPPNGYGVHADPVAAVLQHYGLRAEGRKNLKWDALRAEIAAGRPVIVWVIGQMWAGTPVKYKTSDGRTVIVAHFEHTMIVVGYNSNSVFVVDAYSGQNQSYPVEMFQRSWATLGRMAITGSGLAKPTKQPAPPGNQPEKLPFKFYLPLVSGNTKNGN